MISEKERIVLRELYRVKKEERDRIDREISEILAKLFEDEPADPYDS